jgi:hypothetical protein
METPKARQHRLSGAMIEQSLKADVDEDKKCRFCFSDDDPDDKLLSPCKCIGSQNFVHTSCLVKWQTFVMCSYYGRLHCKDQRHVVCNVCRSEFSHLPPSREELFPNIAARGSQRELWTSTAAEANADTMTETFDTLGLNEYLLRGIYASGVEHPSRTQQRFLKPLLLGHDVLVQSSAGSGKSTASCIAVLHRINPTIHECQAIILAPTSALAHQISRCITALSDFMDVQIQTCVGTSVRGDIVALQSR